ncbi:plastocyanin/azurin family copper-binding protein [Halobaculum litoreum]|uniref:Plastocyanin/azurin family copper-binding protein n=1 Tax=Halobaculum litoreum TaxID=3031998 RepID=A0ABD5XW75_9EURY
MGERRLRRPLRDGVRGRHPERRRLLRLRGFDGEDAARSAYAPGDTASGDVPGGESYEHTFEAEGEYEYFCIPHESVGMVGTVTVSADATPPPAETAAAVPDVGDAARTLGVAVTTALLAVVGFAYVFLKYGGDYDRGDAGE